MSVATWSLRERAVWSLPPTGPTISVRRRSIAMWMSSSSLPERERAGVELLLHALEPAEQRVAVGVGDDPGGGEHRRVGARLLDVVGPEAPVEPDRGVELTEDGCWGSANRDTPASCLAWRSSCAPPGPTTLRPGCCTCPPRRTTTPTRAATARARRLLRLAVPARAGTPRAGRSAAWRSSTGSSSACSPPSRREAGDALARRFIRLTLGCIAAVAAARR